MFSGGEAALHEFVGLVGNEAEWESGWGGDLASGEIWGDVAGVCEPVFAGGGDLDAAGGGEAELALGDEDVVEAGENFAGVVRGFAAEGAEDHGDAHGCGESLSGDVPDDGGEGAVGRGGDEEEVAADFAGGKIYRVDLEAGRGAGGALKEELLDGAGGVEFGGECGTGAGGIDHLGTEERVLHCGGGLEGDGVEEFQVGGGVGCVGCGVGESNEAYGALSGAERSAD